MAALVKNVMGKFVPPSLPAADAFSGQTILITGGTSGLGVAAAVHYLNLGAKEVIITARKASSPRADEAKQKILAGARGDGGKGKKKKSKSRPSSSAGGEVTVMELDMNSYASIQGFVDSLKAKYDVSGGIDVAVLNAGTMNTTFVRSFEGAEETIQVNTLSTTLLALLLLPWMKSKHASRSNGPAHLVFVGSGSHLEVNIKPWPSYVDKDGGVIAHYSKEENYPKGALSTTMYGSSKLMLQYAIEEVSKLAQSGSGGSASASASNGGEPEVIITTVCPGPVATDIARNFSANSPAAKVLIPLFFMAQAKSPDYGARIYVNASVATPEKHGKFLRDYLTDKQYEAKSAPMISSPEARKMQAQIWKEIKETLVAKVPDVQVTLEQE